LFATFLVESTLGRLLRFVPGARERYLPTASLAAPRQVPWVLGAAMAIRRTAFEAVGGFDTSFFMYFEEVDLCYRLAQAGWQVHFAPVATVVHTGAASTRQYRTEMAVQAQASRLHFYWRHYPAWSAVALVILVDSLALLRWLLYPVRARLAPTAERRAQLAAERVAWARVLRGDWLRVRSAAG
jgi:GT2 family glycosyltransferase